MNTLLGAIFLTLFAWTRLTAADYEPDLWKREGDKHDDHTYESTLRRSVGEEPATGHWSLNLATVSGRCNNGNCMYRLHLTEDDAGDGTTCYVITGDPSKTGDPITHDTDRPPPWRGEKCLKGMESTGSVPSPGGWTYTIDGEYDLDDNLVITVADVQSKLAADFAFDSLRLLQLRGREGEQHGFDATAEPRPLNAPTTTKQTIGGGPAPEMEKRGAGETWTLRSMRLRL